MPSNKTKPQPRYIIVLRDIYTGSDREKHLVFPSQNKFVAIKTKAGNVHDIIQALRLLKIDEFSAWEIREPGLKPRDEGRRVAVSSTLVEIERRKQRKEDNEKAKILKNVQEFNKLPLVLETYDFSEVTIKISRTPAIYNPEAGDFPVAAISAVLEFKNVQEREGTYVLIPGTGTATHPLGLHLYIGDNGSVNVTRFIKFMTASYSQVLPRKTIEGMADKLVDIAALITTIKRKYKC